MNSKILYTFIICLTFFLNTIRGDVNIPKHWKDPYDLNIKTDLHDINAPKDKWIDPHDMRPSKEYLKYTDNPSSLHKSFDDKRICNDAQSFKIIEMHYKRTINLLLNSILKDKNEIDLYSGYLYMKINSDNYEVLKNYANNVNEFNEDLIKIMNILEDTLIKPTHQHLQEYLESWFHKFLNVVLSREGIITIIFICYVFIIYQMIRAKFYLWYMVKFLILNVLIFEFVFTWIHLYQKSEIEQFVNKVKYQDVPVECNPESMNTWRFLQQIISQEDKCHTYYQVNYQDVFWKVSPGFVLTEMLSKLIEEPFNAIGRTFANTSYVIYNKFPWPMNIIIFPVVLLFFCIIIIVILSFLFKRNLKFNLLFNLFSISNSASVEQRSDNRLTDQNIERLLRLAENNQQSRQFIENVRIKESSSQNEDRNKDSKIPALEFTSFERIVKKNSKESITNDKDINDETKVRIRKEKRRHSIGASGDYF